MVAPRCAFMAVVPLGFFDLLRRHVVCGASAILRLFMNAFFSLVTTRLGAGLLWIGVVLGSAAGVQAGGERMALWSERAPTGGGGWEPAEVMMEVHRPERPNGVVIVICPGGGYGGLVTEGEGTGIARWLNVQGITGVVLAYRLPRGRALVPLLDAQRALRTVRSRAQEWGCDPKKVGIIGFSAGGHLASTAATHFDDGDPLAVDPVERAGCRPDFAILVYPVITMGELAHGGSKTNLLGPSPSAGQVDYFSTETQVTSRTSPTFLTHALDDRVVPPDHSRMFHRALREHQVRCEYLELPSGDHGLNGYQGPMWEAWQAACLEWLVAGRFMEGKKAGAAVDPAVEAGETAGSCGAGAK